MYCEVPWENTTTTRHNTTQPDQRLHVKRFAKKLKNISEDENFEITKQNLNLVYYPYTLRRALIIWLVTWNIDINVIYVRFQISYLSQFIASVHYWRGYYSLCGGLRGSVKRWKKLEVYPSLQKQSEIMSKKHFYLPYHIIKGFRVNYHIEICRNMRQRIHRSCRSDPEKIRCHKMIESNKH